MPVWHLAWSLQWKQNYSFNLLFGSLELHYFRSIHANKIKLMDEYATGLHAYGLMATCEYARVLVHIQYA